MLTTSTQATRLYSFRYSEVRTYLFTALFIIGNIVLPQLCHLMPQGGLVWLPIYFFTLVSAYKYGLTVGLLTAVLSPVANHLLFGMPAAGMLPVILVKSVLLATAAGFAARYFRCVTLLITAAVVLSYQIIGGCFEWMLTDSLSAALQDFRLGLPGIAVQIIGGWLILKHILKK